ncbi:DUF2630 family protein [Streptomyces sp. NPDC004129]
MTSPASAGANPIMRQIHVLADKNEQLRHECSSHQINAGTEHQRLSALEIQLDLCMGLLRQRRPHSTPARAPSSALVRPASHYLS